jgi:hypothetical protein
MCWISKLRVLDINFRRLAHGLSDLGLNWTLGRLQ